MVGLVSNVMIEEGPPFSSSGLNHSDPTHHCRCNCSLEKKLIAQRTLYSMRRPIHCVDGRAFLPGYYMPVLCTL